MPLWMPIDPGTLANAPGCLLFGGIPHVRHHLQVSSFCQSGMQVTGTEVVLPAFETMRQAEVATMQLSLFPVPTAITSICLEATHGVL